MYSTNINKKPEMEIHLRQFVENRSVGNTFPEKRDTIFVGYASLVVRSSFFITLNRKMADMAQHTTSTPHSIQSGMPPHI